MAAHKMVAPQAGKKAIGQGGDDPTIGKPDGNGADGPFGDMAEIVDKKTIIKTLATGFG